MCGMSRRGFVPVEPVESRDAGVDEPPETCIRDDAFALACVDPLCPRAPNANRGTVARSRSSDAPRLMSVRAERVSAFAAADRSKEARPPRRETAPFPFPFPFVVSFVRVEAAGIDPFA